ncbi:hypothetical protein BC833DRAFT_608748 [Globomyces pollinis-pini]|nr:hypothetical protein BC833DRAFT_608748 [Globomyces pollinis-pini]
MLELLAEGQKDEIDCIVYELTKFVDTFHSNISLCFEGFGFFWYYDVRKTAFQLESALSEQKSTLPNILFATTVDDEIVQLHWEEIDATHTTDGVSTLSLSTIVLYFICHLGNSMSFLLVFMLIAHLGIIAYYFPKVSIVIAFLVYMIRLVGIHQFIPYPYLTDRANQLYINAPPVLKTFLKIRLVVLGIKVNDEIVYMLLSFKDNKIKVQPMINCPQGSHICVYVTVDLLSLKPQHLNLDVVELRRNSLFSNKKI